MSVTKVGHKIVIELSMFNAGLLCGILDLAKTALVNVALPFPAERILVDLNSSIKKLLDI